MNIRSRPRLLMAALGLSITCFLIAFLPSPKTSPDQYGIVVDCGSSGSRIYIFTWKEDQTPFHPDSQLTWAPRGEEPWILEIKGGIQTYGNADLAAKSLRPLFDYASSKLPSEIASNTDIFVMATAGLRELGDEAMEKSILEAVYVILRSEYPFRVARQNVQVLEPNLEAAYFWISMYTYMKGTLNISQPFGVTEMGGASMQIAFQPDPTDLIPPEYRFYFTDSEITYKLYANSFAGFGFNSARRTIYEMIVDDHLSQNTSEQVVVNPCLFAGQSQEIELDGETFTMKGNGDFDKCKEFTLEFINKTAPCEWERCSFGGHYQPRLKGDFILADNFGKIIVRLTGAAFGKVQVTPTQLDEAAREICSQDFAEVIAEFNDTNIDLNTIGDFCYGSAYALNLLVDGFGFPKEGELTAVYAEAYIYSWPLGAMVVERQKKMFAIDGLSSGNLTERKEIYQEPLLWCLIVAILIGFVVWRWRSRNSSSMTRSRSSGGFMSSFVEVKFH